MSKAVILLSGGLDSTTVLAIARSRGYECYALSFDYGQKQKSELNAAIEIAKSYQVKEHRIMKVSLSDIGGSALTDQSINIPDYKKSSEIPITYVPARNTIFLSLALAWSEVIGSNDIFIGVNSVDYSGYPDCRPEYIEAFEKMANLATKNAVMGKKVTIHTPLIYLNKAEIIGEGLKLGVDYSNTITCYRANDLGEACGKCDACELRKIGFKNAGFVDPTKYV
ncbi:MAG: 7-cyano-7-deazaguanine synthase QueC [Gammaproteobacteria bacterium]|nr:7-cyano-7-deazaguanine synthase QueC [Gammaproteobacteria bacterium]